MGTLGRREGEREEAEKGAEKTVQLNKYQLKKTTHLFNTYASPDTPLTGHFPSHFSWVFSVPRNIILKLPTNPTIYSLSVKVKGTVPALTLSHKLLDEAS